ncbi:MAG: RluA family pseudouridine synthase [Deltaproteobacteria bacterium]|nr:RluA family pseudouridine synthase [Deltaproteobacteria bacterium]
MNANPDLGEIDWRVRVLYEDERLIAINKPAGVVVIPARDEPVEHALRACVAKLLGRDVWVVHRIDRDTSGVVVFAKSAEAHRALSMAFEQRAVQKRYDAFCHWSDKLQNEMTISTPLHPARRGKMRPALAAEEGALACETQYLVHAKREGAAWLHVKPKTGRQHQIRVHLRSIGAPLLVDSVYGGASERAANSLGKMSPALTRLTLHAGDLVLRAGASGEGSGLLRITAPLPQDLVALGEWMVSR